MGIIGHSGAETTSVGFKFGCTLDAENGCLITWIWTGKDSNDFILNRYSNHDVPRLILHPEKIIR